MEMSTRWWVRLCTPCQARQMVSWAVLSMSLPNGADDEWFRVTMILRPPPGHHCKSGNIYILLVTNRSSRHASMCAVTLIDWLVDLMTDYHIYN